MTRARALCIMTVVVFAATAVCAQDTDPELAFMPETSTVTLLNDGGKYVAIDLKHIDKGGTCRIDKDATLLRMGPGSGPNSVRVRYIAPQLSSGGCPFMTEFDMPGAQYAAARKIFLDRKEAAQHKVEQLKKDLGQKWDEVTGKSK